MIHFCDFGYQTMDTSFAVEDQATSNKFSGAEIFLVDDEPLVVDQLTYFLRSAGFQRVQGFSDSTEAIKRMQSGRPDVIFTDIRMPGHDGNSLAKIARSFPHLHSVPIIAITADNSLETSRSIVHDGASSVLIKPVDREIFVQRTVDAIDNGNGQRMQPDFEPELEFYADPSHNEPSQFGLFGGKESLQQRRRRGRKFRD